MKYSGNGNDIPVTTLSSLGRTSEIVMISENNSIEAYYSSSNRLSGDNYWQCGTVGKCSGPESGARWDKDIAGIPPPPLEWQFAQMPRYRHSGVSNFAFADGHVKAIAKGQLNWCKNFYYPGIGNAGPYLPNDVIPI